MNTTKHSRILAIDGIRGIAILLVIVGHVIDTFGGPAFLGPLRHAGNLGVRIFFLISGMLITSLLIKEWQTTGTISLKMFYVRRARRIFPAYFVFLISVWLLDFASLINVPVQDYVRALTFTMNYEHSAIRAWSLNHLWSLSAEEQFYLIWPLLLLKLKVDRGRSLCIGMVVGVVFIRVFMWIIFDANGSALTREIQAIFDSMALGALIAFYARPEDFARTNHPLNQWGHYLLPAGILLSAVSIITFFLSKSFYYTVGQSFTNFGIALVLLSITRRPHHLTATLLNNRPLVYIGTISYSLYLWQQITLHHEVSNWFTSFPQNLVVTFCIAACSYHLVERPFLAKKTKD